jgi:hypothetical protein
MPTSTVIEIIPITCAGCGKPQAVKPIPAGQPHSHRLEATERRHLLPGVLAQEIRPARNLGAGGVTARLQLGRFPESPAHRVGADHGCEQLGDDGTVRAGRSPRRRGEDAADGAGLLVPGGARALSRLALTD